MIPKELLAEIGEKKGLTNKEYIEKDYFQDTILFNLFKKTNMFVFKGGTALYKLYQLPRFSEDLDFSIYGEKEAHDIEETIKAIVATSNLAVKSVKKTKDSLLVKISCKGILTRYNTIRMDISLKNKVLAGIEVKNYVSEYVDINPFVMRVLKREEMIAEKIHALLARKKARDLFDIFFLLRIAPLDENLIKKKLKIFDLAYDCKVLKERIDDLEEIWEKELRTFILGELPEFKTVEEFVLSKLDTVKIDQR